VKHEVCERINKNTLRRAGNIVLTDGHRLKGYRVQIGTDSTVYWIESMPNKWVQRRIATNEIRQIVLKSHAKGALEGMGIGILAGATLGTLVLGSQLGGDENLDTGKFLEGLVLISGAGGGMIGLLVGSAMGSKDTFLIDDSFEK